MIPLLVVLSLAGLAGWRLLLRDLPPWSAPDDPALRFGFADVAVAGLLVFLFVSSIAAPPTEETPEITAEILLQSAVLVLGVVGVVFAILVARRRSPAAMFGFRPERPGRVLWLGLLCLLATYPLVSLLAAVVTYQGATTTEEDGLVGFLRAATSWEDRAVGIALAVAIAPFVEEVIFRGYLYGVIRQYGGRLAAAVTSAILFAAVHHNIPGIPALFVLGLGFAFAYERTGSLLAPILMHVLFNATHVGVLYFFPEQLP